MYCIEETLSEIKRFQELGIELKKCHFFKKLTSSCEFGEFISFSKTTLNEEILKKELQQLIEKNQKESRKILLDSFNINENRIYLKLNRLSTVKSVFIDIFECQDSYGSSKIFHNKGVRVIDGKSENELTKLRITTASNVVSQLVALGGGYVTYRTNVATTSVHIGPQTGSSMPVGSVRLDESSDTSQVNYLRIRSAELLKNEHRDLSEELVHQLISATIVFDMLSVKLSKPLILNSSVVPTSATKSNCKGGTFVLYNFARVCSILDKFDEMVSKGVFKPLLSIYDLDYNLLLKEEDWRLIFDFLAEWPSVVADCQDLSQPKLHILIGFLSSLASNFSVYYKYNRVLNDGLDHMLPLMEARIYLMKAIKQVFLIAFSLLQINAPTKM